MVKAYLHIANIHSIRGAIGKKCTKEAQENGH